MAVDKEFFDGNAVRAVRPPTFTPRSVYRQACGDYSVECDADIEVEIPDGRTIIVRKRVTMRATDTTGRRGARRMRT